ncbi:GNAT family N-acetyltransferase [Maribacter sp. 2-571]|uniref:GNAT family N-acetyltransferase n=1 Tax=Maribacter sp. 2-571 TaxID=3417569 RepID=UPI003D326B5B
MTITLLKGNTVTTEDQKQITLLYRQLNAQIKQLSVKKVLERDERSAFVVCRIENVIVGMAVMAIYTVISGKKGMIEDVVVDEKYRGNGIGKKIMQVLLSEAKNRNVTELLLFTGHHRKPAIKLYEGLGFTLKQSGLYTLKTDTLSNR